MTNDTRIFVSYRDFGAVGDGHTDDFAAIIAAHAYANEHGLPVRAAEGDTYYIGRRSETAVIRTDTDWTGAAFIIDDSEVPPEEREHNIFHVASGNAAPMDLLAAGTTALNAGQTAISAAPGVDCYVFVTDDTTRQYIREGLNQNNGSAKRDCFLLHADGTIDPQTPVIWDFDHISAMTASPIDQTTLTLHGGTFTTIANQAESRYTYYQSGIRITRSNVVLDGMTHNITGELDHGAPYSGMLQISSCANVTVKNCTFTAHRTYETIGSAGKPVSMGTYDISCGSAMNVSFIDCTQTTDIMDRRYWGLFGSNYCKNLTLERCRFSRFDAHMGVTNAVIRGCTLGHQCLNAIGHGTLTIEDSTLFGRGFINLRSDYGSTWKGDVIVKNCTWLPAFSKDGRAAFIGGHFHGGHDFGYDCYMPQSITIDGLTVDDSSQAENESYEGIFLLGNITPGNTDESFTYTYPYHVTKSVTIKNFRSATGKSWRVSENPYMYRGTEIKGE